MTYPPWEDPYDPSSGYNNPVWDPNAGGGAGGARWDPPESENPYLPEPPPPQPPTPIPPGAGKGAGAGPTFPPGPVIFPPAPTPPSGAWPPSPTPPATPAQPTGFGDIFSIFTNSEDLMLALMKPYLMMPIMMYQLTKGLFTGLGSMGPLMAMMMPGAKSIMPYVMQDMGMFPRPMGTLMTMMGGGGLFGGKGGLNPLMLMMLMGGLSPSNTPTPTVASRALMRATGAEPAVAVAPIITSLMPLLLLGGTKLFGGGGGRRRRARTYRRRYYRRRSYRRR